jgi:hypothetical protein
MATSICLVVVESLEKEAGAGRLAVLSVVRAL